MPRARYRLSRLPDEHPAFAALFVTELAYQLVYLVRLESSRPREILASRPREILAQRDQRNSRTSCEVRHFRRL
jgi:hypothetical protein